MKHIPIIVLLIPLYLNAQVSNNQVEINIQKQIDSGGLVQMTGQRAKVGYKWKKQIAPVTLMFLAGIADAFTETISHNYKGFKKVFPGANDQIFDPGLSFRRKYQNNDPAQGEKFFGSKSFLVWTTDAYHAGRFAQHLFMAGAVTLKITGRRQKWWVYGSEILGYWIVNRIAFTAVFGYFQSKR